MGLNSGSLPLMAAGAAYTMSVNATIPAGSRGDGCAIAVFQDASFTELGRAVIQIVPLPIPLGSPQTDIKGAFAFALAPQSASFELWADYAGSDALWPAAAAVAINTPPAPAITGALPGGVVGSLTRVSSVQAVAALPISGWVARCRPDSYFTRMAR